MQIFSSYTMCLRTRNSLEGACVCNTVQLLKSAIIHLEHFFFYGRKYHGGKIWLVRSLMRGPRELIFCCLWGCFNAQACNIPVSSYIAGSQKSNISVTYKYLQCLPNTVFCPGFHSSDEGMYMYMYKTADIFSH